MSATVFTRTESFLVLQDLNAEGRSIYYPTDLEGNKHNDKTYNYVCEAILAGFKREELNE